MSDDLRPVWLDGNDRNIIVWAMNHAYSHGLSGWSADLGALLAQYEAAPANPAEAIVGWFNTNFQGAEDDRGSVLNGADEILRALGMPDA